MSEIKRRHLVMTAVSAAVLLPGTGLTQDTKQMTGLVHVVHFWLKNPGSAADRDMLINGLKTLAAVPSVRALHVGVPASTEQRDVVDSSFDVAEVMVFDDVEGQNAYQVHPLHLAFVEQHSHLWSKVIVRDSVMF